MEDMETFGSEEYYSPKCLVHRRGGQDIKLEDIYTILTHGRCFGWLGIGLVSRDDSVETDRSKSNRFKQLMSQAVQETLKLASKKYSGECQPRMGKQRALKEVGFDDSRLEDAITCVGSLLHQLHDLQFGKVSFSPKRSAQEFILEGDCARKVLPDGKVRYFWRNDYVGHENSSMDKKSAQ
eukprot:2973446-Amphidinium_carterae.1